MAASDNMRAFIQAFEEAWDEVVRGVPVSIDLYRFREAFARKMLTLAEQQGLEAADVPPAHRELSRRVLSLHCDFRYGERDMERVAQALRRALSGRGGRPRSRETEPSWSAL